MRELKILGLFFTKGISVKFWKGSGLLDREKVIYEKLLEEEVFDKILWFSYGSKDKFYENELKNGIEIIEMPAFFNFPFGKLIYSFLLPFFQREHLKKCTVYKTNQIWGSWAAVLAKWFYKKKLFVRTGFTLSHISLHRKKRLNYLKGSISEYFAYKNSDCSSVSSQETFNYVKQRFKPDNLYVLPNFINTEVFKPFNLEKKRDIIFVGRLSEVKNLFNLIKAVAETNCSLDIYGAGELKYKLQAYISKLKLQNQVFLKGKVANKRLPDLINQYKIYILPSFYEGMPKTLLEAMSCGAACIGTNVKGISEVIDDNKNGILCEIDSKCISEAINLLISSVEKRKFIGENARKLIETDFSLEKVLEIEERIYKSIMQ